MANGNVGIPSRFENAREATNPEMIEWETVGMIVVGYLRHSKLVNGANGPYRVVHVETADGMRAMVAGAILSDLLSEVPADAEVCIEYLGFKGRSKDFKVRYLPPAKRQ